MERTTKKIELEFERLIPASPEEVYDAWLDPEIPGNPWHEADKLILDAKVDGLFYWSIRGDSQYGRFTKTERPARIQHTWVSPHTWGEESMVTLTFERKGEDTLMTLVHSDFPEDSRSSHEDGWNYFLGMFSERFATVASRAK